MKLKQIIIIGKIIKQTIDVPKLRDLIKTSYTISGAHLDKEGRYQVRSILSAGLVKTRVTKTDLRLKSIFSSIVAGDKVFRLASIRLRKDKSSVEIMFRNIHLTKTVVIEI